MHNPYKMAYHIEPPCGLLNDPNGLVQFNGTYYFFHQWNRFALDHTYKEWGLFTSDDLVHWKSQGSALLPDRIEDRHGVHSGSAIVHDDQLYLFYTGSNKEGSVRTSRQCISVSSDGRSFLKLPECIETPPGFTQHHRDPKVIPGKNGWLMLVGAQKDNFTGAVALYTSDDLVHWTYKNILYDENLDQVSECPDLFSLGKADILFVCPQTRRAAEDGNGEVVDSYASYVPGFFDEESGTFRASGPRKVLDSGFDFYSPQTFVDSKHRRIMTGWMSRMSAEQESACPTRAFGYIHCLALPRVLSWEDGTLRQRPIPEVESLRIFGRRFFGPDGSFEVENSSFELFVKRSHPANPFYLSLLGGIVQIGFDPDRKTLCVTRRDWANGNTQTRSINVPELMELRIFVDASSSEIFVNDGLAVFSMRFFVDEENLRIDFTGLAPEENLEYYQFSRKGVK